MLHDLVCLDGVSEEYLQGVKSFIDEWNNDSPSIDVQTSGSTAAPKTISLEKHRMRRSARATGEFFEFKKKQVALLNLSPDYIAGKLMIVRAIEHEMKLVLAPLQSNPLLTLGNIEINFGAFVPSQIAEILSNPATKAKLEGIHNIIIGGAPLHPTLENELTALSNQIYSSFGMTETITHFALRKLGTPIYKCLPSFKIAADDNSCLVIHPNQVVSEILFTNDVIDFIDQETFKWCGRFDNVINSGGIKIHPEKMEKMLAHLLPDNRFYVTSKEDSKLGEVAILVVEGEVAEEKVMNDAKESLPKHHAPKELIVVQKFEETPTQKIIRKKF